MNTQNKNQVKVVLFILIVLMHSCVDLFMKDEPGNVTNFNQFLKCELDTNAFSYILEENIKGDIVCLQENLHMFMDIVDTERPGFVSKDTLKRFIENGPMEFNNKEEVLQLLDGVFDLSYLVLGGEKGQIARKDVDRLIDLMIYFNEHIWKVYKYFTSTDRVNFARHSKERKIVFEEMVLITNKIRTLLNLSDRPNLDRIDSKVFIEKFFSSKPETLQKIHDLMFLKSIFMGGQKFDLTYREFEDALHKLPALGLVAFDLIKMNKFDFNQDQQIMTTILLEDISTLKEALFYDDSSLVSVFSIYDIMNAVTTFLPDIGIDIQKYPREIMSIKEAILGQGGEFFSNQEIIRGFHHAKEILSRGEMFFRVYDYYREDLDSTDPITHDFSDFSVNNSQEEFFLREFSRIVNNYHFVKGSFQIPVFHYDYYRNPNGFFEIAIVEYFVKELMAFFGSPHEDARGGYHLQLEQTATVIEKVKRVLKDVGIIIIGREGGGEVASVTDNFVLMSVLFQYQSDGCDPNGVCMEVPEATEFLISLLSAMQVKDFFIQELEKYCGQDVDQYGRINVDCFRENFINVLTASIPGD